MNPAEHVEQVVPLVHWVQLDIQEVQVPELLYWPEGQTQDPFTRVFPAAHEVQTVAELHVAQVVLQATQVLVLLL